MDDCQGMTALELLGPLNDVEEKYAPPQLFVSGQHEFLKEGGRVSIVGSRKASSDGIARAKRLAKLLTEKNVVIVSGLAEGIDTAAHTAAIEAGGRTVAVLGTPLSETYPKKNTKLQAKIMREHLCISQFSQSDRGGRRNFPIRNRTMALISDATVIIEASDSSGSLHQGWEALRLGRGLYITKTSVDDPKLSWPKKFINYGASVLSDETFDDLLTNLPTRSQAYADGPIPF